MDRNEEFRKRLDKRLNKGRLISKGGFDPTPYVDILMEKTYYDDAEDLQELIDDVMTDPKFDFIFGHSSLLNTDQKTQTAAMMLERVIAAQEFDPKPHAQDLLDIYGTPAFDKYIEHSDEEDDEEFYDFEPYYADYSFTKEQKELISEAFEDMQYEKLYKNKKSDLPVSKARGLLSCLLICGALVFGFLTPNLLQRFGYLPSDAGWLIKIGVGLISVIILFLVAAKIIQIIANRALKKIRRLNDL
jgi:hypothetical protein